MYIYIWLCVLVAVLWFYYRKTYSYHKKHGINHLPPIPVFGNMARVMLRLDHRVDPLIRLYFSFPEDRFVGNYDLSEPTVMIRDPELIRLIGVKDFDYFTDHRKFPGGNKTFFSKSLFGLRGQKWREMRSTLSPAFTGSKLRGMVPLIQDCSGNLVRYLSKELKQNGHLDVDTKDLFSRYTNDVIATCAFGVKVDSIAERENQFYNMGCDFTNLKVKQIVKTIILKLLPYISKLFNSNNPSKEAENFLSDIVLRTMKNRDMDKNFRPDLIQILMEVKKGTLKHENVKDEKDAGFATVEESNIGKEAVKRVWDDEHLAAQALLFFFAGFETVSTALMFLLYELALDPDVQAKLRQEIEDYHRQYHGKMDYDNINQMKYMDMVFSETLRKWPPSPNADRMCQKRYNLGKPNDKATKDFYLEEGQVVMIPTWPIHHDPKYYPDPERFDPERFSDDNKHNIKPFTYLPFGVGPRNCIGSRFAIIEIKTIVFDLLKNFEISPAPNTRVPAKLDPSHLSMRMLGGQWIRIKPRNTKAE